MWTAPLIDSSDDDHTMALSTPGAGAVHHITSGPRRQCSNFRPVRLLDDLVGAQQNRWGYGKAERLGGLEVYDHLKFRRKLHREIARLRAAQNAIDISGGTKKGVYPIGSV